jgi:cell division protein YceG involved in septum cleavage
MSNDIDDFKAGEYGIQNKKIKDIIDEMANGLTVTHKFVILEGTNIYELEKQINNSYLIMTAHI